jgi:hypothetical protein
MGMGLSIAQSIVEVHGGSIGLRNAGTRGTIVELTLPLQGPAVSQGPLSVVAADSPAARQQPSEAWRPPATTKGRPPLTTT